MSGRREAIRQKIMSRVEIVPAPEWLPPELGPCHIWTGPTSGEGRGGDYGRMSLDGQTVAVHLVSWTNEHGFVPGKKQLDHLCRRRRCVNDRHLELVTHKQNQKRRDLARQTGGGGIAIGCAFEPAGGGLDDRAPDPGGNRDV